VRSSCTRWAAAWGAHLRHDWQRPRLRRARLSLLLLLRLLLLLLLLGRHRHSHIQAEQPELLRGQLLFPSAPIASNQRHRW
jgi:hypothetical protein